MAILKPWPPRTAQCILYALCNCIELQGKTSPQNYGGEQKELVRAM